jgi:hypothetical protein
MVLPARDEIGFAFDETARDGNATRHLCASALDFNVLGDVSQGYIEGRLHSRALRAVKMSGCSRS